MKILSITRLENHWGAALVEMGQAEFRKRERDLWRFSVPLLRFMCSLEEESFFLAVL